MLLYCSSLAVVLIFFLYFDIEIKDDSFMEIDSLFFFTSLFHGWVGGKHLKKRISPLEASHFFKSRAPRGRILSYREANKNSLVASLCENGSKTEKLCPYTLSIQLHGKSSSLYSEP